MGKGAVKHEANILNDIQLLLNQQNGIISQLQIIQIIQKYYSEGYAESMGFKKIEREITRRNMVKKIKVNIGNISQQQLNKQSSISQLLSLYISPTVPDDSKRSLISAFVRNSIPCLEIPAMKRSISKELFLDPTTYNQKRPEIMEFPSVQFRAMLLHQFLISTFKTDPFSLDLISKLIPVHLSAQIIRSYDTNPIILSLISPLKRSYQFEIDILIPYLRPPFHMLVQKIDSTHNSIIPTAVIEIPRYSINKRFDFINDPSAISDYWNIIFSLQSEKLLQFPLILSNRFNNFFSIYFKKLSLREVPFFPYQVEKFSEKVGVSPSASSYSIQKIFKHKLKILQCSKETYLESKLFPISGFLPFLFTKTSIFKAPEPKFPESLSTPFKVDGSLNCLAKIYAASQLTEEGYIINRRSNFKLFKKQVKKWISKCSRFRNLFESLKEDDSFRSLIKFEMALLIEEMRFPFFYYNRIGLKPIKTIPLEIQPEDENESQNSNNNENENQNQNGENQFDVDDDDQNEQKSIMRSNSANFNVESFKQVSKILHSPSFNLFKEPSSRPTLSNLNDIFTKSFPDFTKEDFFNHDQPQNNKKMMKKKDDDDDENENDNDNEILPFHNLYFQDNDTDFPTAYAIDSPLNSDMSNDEVVEPPSIFSPFESSQSYPRNKSKQKKNSSSNNNNGDDDVNESSGFNGSEISNCNENDENSGFNEDGNEINNNNENEDENSSLNGIENDENENSGFNNNEDGNGNISYREKSDSENSGFIQNGNENSGYNENQIENSRDIDDADNASNSTFNEDSSYIQNGNNSENEEEGRFNQNNRNGNFIENQSENGQENENENSSTFSTGNADFSNSESTVYNGNENEGQLYTENQIENGTNNEDDNSNSSFSRDDDFNENGDFNSNSGHFESSITKRKSIFSSDESENNDFDDQQNEDVEDDDDDEEEEEEENIEKDEELENEESFSNNNFNGNDNSNFNFDSGFNNSNANEGYDDDDDINENEVDNENEDNEDDGFIEHHFLPNFIEDYDYDDEIVQYPVLNPSDFFEATETEFLSLFQMKKRIVDVDISVSVAVEFLKIVLAAPSTPKTNDLRLRQTVHFSQKDAIDAIWLLNSIDVYKHKQKMRFPENGWELPLPEDSFPRPLFMAYCDNSEKNDPVPLKIVWSKTAETEFTEEDENEDNSNDDDDDDIIEGDEFDDDDGFLNDDRKSGDYITFRFKNVTFREQISSFKKEKQTFKFERQRLNLPKLPDVDATWLFRFNPDQIYDQLYNSDPLGQFCFGQYDTDFPSIEDFPCRVIMNHISSSGVFGAPLTDIVNIFGFSPLDSDNVISKVNFLCTLNFICRVPSSRLVPLYSRFIPCNTLCKPVNEKIELVSPHVWSNFDGFINKEVQMNLLKNISTFVFAHEFCDFLVILEEFPYVSPYDLCLLLQVLECEEIIFSQYFKKIKPNLFEDEINIPIPPFETFEKFLIILDYQKKNDEIDITFHRIIRTNRSMLPNLCVINNY